jgi:hypothetical protein
MSVEYIASIAEADYPAFRMIITTPLPDDYGMWLRVRDRGKLRSRQERGASVAEVEITPMEFGVYCKSLRRPDFSIAGLDRCARDKASAQEWDTSGSRALYELASGLRPRPKRRATSAPCDLASRSLVIGPQPMPCGHPVRSFRRR